MKTKWIIAGLLTLAPTGALAQLAPTATPAAAPATPAAAPAAPAATTLDASRVQDCGPLHIQINKVSIQGNNYFITGELTTSEKTWVKLYQTGGANWRAAGATSLGGDPGLVCDTVTLGDVARHDVPSISADVNTAYPFSVEIVTSDGAPNGLQELRIATETKEGRKVATFPKLMPDKADLTGITAPTDTAGATPATADTTAAGPTAAGVAATTQPAVAAADDSATGNAVTAGTATTASSGGTTAAAAKAKSVKAVAIVPAKAGVAAVAVAPSADAVAQADIKALQAAITAKQWKTADQQVAALKNVEKNGANKSTLSAAEKKAVDASIRVGAAEITLGKLNPPKGYDDFINRAKIEMNAGMNSQAQADLGSASRVPKITAAQKKQIAQLEAELAKASAK